MSFSKNNTKNSFAKLQKRFTVFIDDLKRKHLIPQKMTPQMVFGALIFLLLIVGSASAMLLSSLSQDVRQQASGPVYEACTYSGQTQCMDGLEYICAFPGATPEKHIDDDTGLEIRCGAASCAEKLGNLDKKIAECEGDWNDTLCTCTPGEKACYTTEDKCNSFVQKNCSLESNQDTYNECRSLLAQMQENANQTPVCTQREIEICEKQKSVCIYDNNLQRGRCSTSEENNNAVGGSPQNCGEAFNFNSTTGTCEARECSPGRETVILGEREVPSNATSCWRGGSISFECDFGYDHQNGNCVTSQGFCARPTGVDTNQNGNTCYVQKSTRNECSSENVVYNTAFNYFSNEGDDGGRSNALATCNAQHSQERYGSCALITSTVPGGEIDFCQIGSGISETECSRSNQTFFYDYNAAVAYCDNYNFELPLESQPVGYCSRAITQEGGNNILCSTEPQLVLASQCSDGYFAEHPLTSSDALVACQNANRSNGTELLVTCVLRSTEGGSCFAQTTTESQCLDENYGRIYDPTQYASIEALMGECQLDGVINSQQLGDSQQGWCATPLTNSTCRDELTTLNNCTGYWPTDIYYQNQDVRGDEARRTVLSRCQASFQEESTDAQIIPPTVTVSITTNDLNPNIDEEITSEPEGLFCNNAYLRPITCPQTIVGDNPNISNPLSWVTDSINNFVDSLINLGNFEFGSPELEEETIEPVDSTTIVTQESWCVRNISDANTCSISRESGCPVIPGQSISHIVEQTAFDVCRNLQLQNGNQQGFCISNPGNQDICTRSETSLGSCQVNSTTTFVATSGEADQLCPPAYQTGWCRYMTQTGCQVNSDSRGGCTAIGNQFGFAEFIVQENAPSPICLNENGQEIQPTLELSQTITISGENMNTNPGIVNTRCLEIIPDNYNEAVEACIDITNLTSINILSPLISACPIAGSTQEGTRVADIRVCHGSNNQNCRINEFGNCAN